MADPFATSFDVQARWRTLTADEHVRASVLLGDASRLVRRRWKTIDARVLGGEVDADDVRMVVAGMVKRAMLGVEDGVTEQTETAGPFAHTRKFSNPLGNLYISSSDEETLDPSDGAGAVTGKAFSIDLAPNAAVPFDCQW